MTRMMKEKRKRKFTGMILCAAMIICMPVASVYADPDNTGVSDRVIVSMGDSYSSGEGIDNFYDYDLSIADRVKSKDWLAHRSQECWSGRLRLNGVDGTMRDHRDSNWYFVAASGAETKDIFGSQEKKYRKGLNSDTAWLPAQINVFNQLEQDKKKADYITLTLGGNDLGFTDVVTQAVYVHPFVNKGALADTLENSWKKFYNKTKGDLRNCYEHILKDAGEQATMIVAGYPKLVSEGGVKLPDISPITDYMLPADQVRTDITYGAISEGAKVLFDFDETDVAMINESVTQFNKELDNLVTSCYASGMNICFVPVDVGEGSFDGHEAYSDEPFINEVILLPKEQDIYDFSPTSAYSIHPNWQGAQVYANLVQKKIDELEKNGGHPPAIVRTTSEERDIVVVLDASGSMEGDPINETKIATSKFIDTVVQQDASMGIVTYENSANMMSDFSVDSKYLTAIANNITAGGGTNIESGMEKARAMLQESSAKKKIIVLMSDGEPNIGKVGEDLISYADSIKSDGTYIYTLGFFGGMGSGKSPAQDLMERIASDGCHYEVANADDLKFFFGDIADQISGQKYIYVRIACPVDVEVTHNGETLSSSGSVSSARTSFGTLTFEDSSNETSSTNDNRVKILRLKEGSNYDVKINGNGTGTMNYTIGFMDDSGEYSDQRTFKDIEINEKTQINTVAENSPDTILNVDSDGDGRYDIKYKAKANGIGVIQDYTYIYYIIIGVVSLIGAAVIFILLRRALKKLSSRSSQKAVQNKLSFCTNCGVRISGGTKFCTNCGKPL